MYRTVNSLPRASRRISQVDVVVAPVLHIAPRWLVNMISQIVILRRVATKVLRLPEHMIESNDLP